MLRAGVVGACLVLLAVAVAQLALSNPKPWGAIAIEAAIFVMLIVFERGRYRPNVDATRGTWQPTGERFKDPTSGEIVDVYDNPATGERDYRPAG